MSDSMRESMSDQVPVMQSVDVAPALHETQAVNEACLLYTSDAADE